MSRTSRMLKLGVGAAGAAVTGLVADRYVGRRMRASALEADRHEALGSLRGHVVTLTADDGVRIHAEVDEVIAAHPDVAQKVRDGKVQAAGALIGQVMKAMKGQADAGKVRELIMAKCQ